MSQPLPIVGVLALGVSRGVHVVPDQPVEIRVASDSDGLHVAFGDVGPVRIEVAQDHDVLEQAVSLLKMSSSHPIPVSAQDLIITPDPVA